MSHFAWLPCCNQASPSDCWTLPQRTLAHSAELLARFLQAFSVSDSGQWLIRDTWGTGPTAHTLYRRGRVGESHGDNPKRNSVWLHSYKGSMTKQQQTWHRTTTSWAPAIARKRKGSSPKALSRFTFPGCHKCSSSLDTARPRHHTVPADIQQAVKCLLSRTKEKPWTLLIDLTDCHGTCQDWRSSQLVTRQGRPGSYTVVLKTFGAAAPWRMIRFF